MYKQRREAVIRLHRYNHEKEADKLYRTKLMLYTPWRNEDMDLLSDYPDHRTHYDNRSDLILANEQKFSQNASLIEEAIDDLTAHDPPEHAWDQLELPNGRPDIEQKALGWRPRWSRRTGMPLLKSSSGN